MNTDDILTALGKAVAGDQPHAVSELGANLLDMMNLERIRQPTRFLGALQDALDTFNHAEVDSLCNALVDHLREGDHGYRADIGCQILNALWRSRKFDWMLRVAEMLLQAASASMTLWRLYAEALIEQKHLMAAVGVLHELEGLSEQCGYTKECSQARALQGRAWKQVYLDAQAVGAVESSYALRALQTSMAHYERVYSENESNLQQGVNMLALAVRAKKGTGVETDVAPTLVAKAIVNQVEQHSDKGEQAPSVAGLDAGSQAVMAEACLALEQYDDALQWLGRYVQQRSSKEHNAGAFEIANTLEQFEQLWQIRADKPEQHRLLLVLKAALLNRAGGQVQVHEPGKASECIDALLSDHALEKVLGVERLQNLLWYQTGLKRARAVCQLVDNSGVGIGSGFLMRGCDLGMACEESAVVLTNACVVSECVSGQQANSGVSSPASVRVRFATSADKVDEFSVTRVLASSPRHKLDYAVLAVSGIDVITAEIFEEPHPLASALPEVTPDQRMYVIGHSVGRRSSFLIYDNLLLDHEEPTIHYRSPVEEVSAGSPMFNSAWELIGLHHAQGKAMPRLNNQSGVYAANEGIGINSIVANIQRGFGG